MTNISLYEKETGVEVVSFLTIADNFFTRFAGLQLKPRLLPGYGLILVPCGSIHTFFMFFPIDIVMLGRDGRITGIKSGVKPWRTVKAEKETYAILELPSGAAANLKTGNKVMLKRNQTAPKSLSFLRDYKEPSEDKT